MAMLKSIPKVAAWASAAAMAMRAAGRVSWGCAWMRGGMLSWGCDGARLGKLGRDGYLMYWLLC